jgi:adenylate cyclase
VPHWKYAAAVSLAYVFIPLLHRFGPAVAPLALVAIAYAWIFWLNLAVGTDGGTSFFYLAGAAIGILLVGSDQVLPSIVISTLAAGAIILLHIVAPRDTGFPSSFVVFAANVVVSSAALYGTVFYAVRQYTRAEGRAEHEQQRSERLLMNMLPARVAERLKDGSDSEIADAYPEASILFADMAGFTALASHTAPQEIVQFLNGVYTNLDRLVECHGLEKIKTTGDSYMVVSGVPEARPDHAAALADLALDIRNALAGLADPKGRPVPVRIGIASGPVVAGVVGTRKFFYDVWGDAVNTASRMESTGKAGKIHIAPETRELLGDSFEFEDRGIIDVRGKGSMRTSFLIGRTALKSREPV